MSVMSAAPTYHAPTLNLTIGPPTRDEVQDEMIRCANLMRASGRKAGIWQVATGVGKTFAAGRYMKDGARQHGRRYLFLVHRDILAQQSAEEFKDLGLNFAVEQADRRAVDLIGSLSDVEVVIGSKDSMQGSRLASWPKDFFTDIVMDECHLGASRTFGNVLEHFDYQFLLGLSATPYRLDGTQLFGPAKSLFGDGGFRRPYELEGLDPTARVHEAIAFKYTLPSAIRNGHLAEIIAVPAQTTIDLRDVRISKGKNADFNRGDLDDRISAMVEPLANTIRQHLDRLGIRKAVAFAPDVGSSKALADALCQVGVPARAVWTGSKDHPLPESLKRATLNQYKHGMFRVIVSCEVLTTGWNDPATEAVIMARPTRSLGLFLQMVGRGTRILDGKPKCHVIGFEWQGAEGVCGTLDLFLEDEPNPKVRQAAAKHRTPKGEDFDPQAELEKIKERVAADEERERRAMEAARLRVTVKKQDIKHKYREFSVYNAGDILGVQPIVDRKRAKAEPPSQRQLEILKDYGIKRATGLDRDGAQALIDQCLDRTFRRQATPEQVRKLLEKGVAPEQARGLSHDEAAKRLASQPPSDGLRKWLARQMGWATGQIDTITHSDAVAMFRRWKATQNV
jgi:superfamily II DNA or RNA helicase